MLALSLERLAAAQYVSDLDVRIYLDVAPAKTLDEVEHVRELYLPEAQIFQAAEHPEAPSGCWNILNALKSGYETGAEYVFLVEEDVMVYPDFFKWHWNAQLDHYDKENDFVATCGRRWKYYSHDFYTNPGSCLSRKLLNEVVPHINEKFFEDRRGYMNQEFGVMDEASDLDDGLIRRVLRHVCGEIYYPDSPVCAHQGFWAYGKFAQYKTHGTIDERIEQLRRMLPEIDPKDRYTKDFEPYKWSRQGGLDGTFKA